MVDERAVELYYKRTGRNQALTNVVDWVKKSAPLYSRAFLNGKKELKGKTALEISTGETVSVSSILNSDINYIAIFVAVGSGDGIGNFTVLHRDSFTPEAMQEAKRFGCQRVNDEDSFLPDRPYIDLQSLGAEFGILVPEREVIEMIRGDKRIYAVIPGIRTYPAMANAYFAESGQAEMGGLHCQEMRRQYAVSHLVPCLRSEASTVTGKKCVPTNSIYREKKKGKSCGPLLTHEQRDGCCALGPMTESSSGVYLAKVMYIAAHRTVPTLPKRFRFLDDVLEWYLTVKMKPRLGEPVSVEVHVNQSDLELLLEKAKPTIIQGHLHVVMTKKGKRMSLATFAARANNLGVRRMHHAMFGLGDIGTFSLDDMFHIIKVNRPRVDLMVDVSKNTKASRPSNSGYCPTPSQVAKFVQDVFNDRDFDRLKLQLDFDGEISDPVVMFVSKGFQAGIHRERDDESHYYFSKEHVEGTLHIFHTPKLTILRVKSEVHFVEQQLVMPDGEKVEESPPEPKPKPTPKPTPDPSREATMEEDGYYLPPEEEVPQNQRDPGLANMY